MSTTTKSKTKAFKHQLLCELQTSVGHLSLDDIESVAQAIIHSEESGGRSHVTGVGKPSYVARYIASLLSSTGTPAYFLDATETVHGSSGQVKPGDCVIAISNSGKTLELLNSCRLLKANDAILIAVTANPESPLAELSDYTLIARVASEGDELGLPPRASYIHEIIVLQVLSVYLQYSKNLSRTTYSKWHPGGTIGATLRGGD